MTPQLVDTHAHLDQDEFAEDRDTVIQCAIEAGVTRIVAVGIGAESSLATVQLARRHDAVYAARLSTSRRTVIAYPRSPAGH